MQISFCFMENQLKRPPTISSKDWWRRSMGFSEGLVYCTLCNCTHSKSRMTTLSGYSSSVHAFIQLAWAGYFFGIVWCTGEVLAMNGIHNPWKGTAYQKEAFFEINTGSLEMSTRGYGSLHFPSMLIPNVSLQGFVVWISFRALWTFNFSFRRWWRWFLCLRCCSGMSSFIFWSLFSDQRDRHVDLGVSVEMYSHCIFPLTNLKTVSAVPLALVFESPSRCCRALRYALQHRFICKDQNNEKKNVNSGKLRCFIPLLFFLSNSENKGFTR